MTIKQHAAVRLTWTQRPFDNGVGGAEYLATALDRTFSIVEQNPRGPASMRIREGEKPSTFVGAFSSVKQAQFRAQRMLDEVQ